MTFSHDNLPTLSVLLVVRNAGKIISRALDSLIAQRYPKLELVVWDGLSTDNTLEVLKGYSSLVTTLKSGKDVNHSDGMNQAASLITGDFVNILNADDEYEPGTLWAVADAIIRNPGCEVVTFGLAYYSHLPSGERRLTSYYADADQLAPTLANVLSDLPSYLMSRFVRRDVRERIGPYNHLRHITCDREWMTRLALARPYHVAIPRPLYAFDWHVDSISGNPDNYFRILDEHRLIAETLLARTDLNEAERNIVRQWQLRQLAYGFWKSLRRRDGKRLHAYLREGWKLGGWRFKLVCLKLLVSKAVKRLGLKLSGGIDRG